MARPVEEIQASIIAQVQSQPELAQANSTSKRAIWRLWTYVIAVCINIFEQIMDLFKSDVETLVYNNPPQTPQWIQDRIFKFQYDDTNPQVVQLINLVPQYPVVNPALRIITRCSVKTQLSGRVLIKVAKSEPPEALTPTELSSLQSYINTIGVAGINYSVSSSDADRLYVQANIYYNGNYSSVISDNVIASINTYFSQLPFDGSMKLLDLEIAIRNTTGVSDVAFVNVAARRVVTPISGATYLVQNYTHLSRQWATLSGYIIGEDTAGYTLAESLTFIPQ